MHVKTIEESQRLVLAQFVPVGQAERSRHPAVVADVPVRRVPWISRVVEPGYALGVQGRPCRAAVIDPPRRLSEEGRFAGGTLAISQAAAAKARAQARGDA